MVSTPCTRSRGSHARPSPCLPHPRRALVLRPQPQQNWAGVNNASDQLGWFKVKGSQHASAHIVLGKLPAAVAHLRRTTWQPAVLDALELAREKGLTRGGPSIAAEMIGWAEEGPIHLPEKWIDTIRRFVAWTGDTPLAFDVKTPVSTSKTKRRSHVRTNSPESGAGEPTTKHVPKDGMTHRTTVSRVPVRG